MAFFVVAFVLRCLLLLVISPLARAAGRRRAKPRAEAERSGQWAGGRGPKKEKTDGLGLTKEEKRKNHSQRPRRYGVTAR